MSEFVKEVSDSSFEKDVLGAGKPVLVDFWAEWCAPCRMLAPTVAAVAELYGETAGVVNSDVDSFPRRKGSRARSRCDEQRVDHENDRQVRDCRPRSLERRVI